MQSETRREILKGLMAHDKGASFSLKQWESMHYGKGDGMIRFAF